MWIVAGFLAFAGAGITKLTQSRAQLVAMGWQWVDDLSPSQVKALGALQVLEAITAAQGLVIPGGESSVIDMLARAFGHAAAGPRGDRRGNAPSRSRHR